MRNVVFALSLVVGPLTVTAQERPSASDMPCDRIAALVSARGAVVIGTGEAQYDRFVRDGSFCEVSEAPRASTVKSKDNPACLIGFKCGGVSRGAGS